MLGKQTPQTTDRPCGAAGVSGKGIWHMARFPQAKSDLELGSRY